MSGTVYQDEPVTMSLKGLIRARNEGTEHIILNKKDQVTWEIIRWVDVRQKDVTVHKRLVCPIFVQFRNGDQVAQETDVQYISFRSSMASETFLSYLELFYLKKGEILKVEYWGNNSSQMLEGAGLKSELVKLEFTAGKKIYEAGIDHPYEHETQRLTYRWC